MGVFSLGFVSHLFLMENDGFSTVKAGAMARRHWMCEVLMVVWFTISNPIP
jgi:hypothetical protein